MRHPDEGTLRRLLDEPAGVADADRDHVAGCTTCLADLSTARQDAALVGATLADDRSPEAALDVDAGWNRLRAVVAAPGRERRPVAVPTRGWRTALSSPVAAVVAATALLTGAGAAAATDWLQIFRAERIATVNLSQADLVALPDLSGYGDFDVTEAPDVREVGDAATAADVSGLEVPQVSALPDGVAGEPTYQVGDRMTATFTFSADRAAETAEAEGESLPALPSGLDGSRFRMVAGPGLAAVWSSNSGLPALVVARATAPTAYSSGVPFAVARDYLLSLPGMPDDLAAQLRGFGGDGSTLPLPVAAEQLSSSSAEVDGRPATVLTSRDGALAGVVWVEDGVVTAVGGTLDRDEVLTVARGLR